MKKEELAPKLQEKYQKNADCGGERGLVSDYQNTWFVISPPPPKKLNWNIDLNIVQTANKIISKLKPLKEMSELDKLLSYLFVKKEALSSSRMEGTWSTMDLLLNSAEAEKEEKSDRESILQYAKILIQSAEEILGNTFKLNHKVIKHVHFEIMSKDPKFKGKAGEYRNKIDISDYVFIGGRKIEQSKFNPTPPHHVQEAMDKFIDWITDEDFIIQSEVGVGLPFIVRLALAHSYFEAIHPFRDGNGRVGRVLLAIQMMREGYSPLYLSGYIEANKDVYINALEQSQKKLNYSPIVEFFCEAVIYAAKEVEDNKRALTILQESWMKELKPRRGAAAEKIIAKLIEHPIFSAQQVLEWFDLSKPAVYHAIDQLKFAKIVREKTESKRNRIFVADEVIEIISRDYEESVEDALARAREKLGKAI